MIATTTISDEETFLQDFLVILNPPPYNIDGDLIRQVQSSITHLCVTRRKGDTIKIKL